jgi:hypothetical protein
MFAKTNHTGTYLGSSPIDPFATIVKYWLSISLSTTSLKEGYLLSSEDLLL